MVEGAGDLFVEGLKGTLGMGVGLNGGGTERMADW